MPHLTGKTGPIDKEYDSIPFKNIAIDTMKRNKLNSYNKLVKDVELYDPKTKKSKMIYKPGKPNEQRD